MGRRTSRIDLSQADGVLRVWHDVSGQRVATGDYIVMSNEARLKGERLTMYLPAIQEPVHVLVLDSRPTLHDGVVRHQLRLQPVSGAIGRDKDVETE